MTTLCGSSVERVLKICDEVSKDVGMETTPFVVDWYNDFRIEVAPELPQLIEVSGRNRLGVICISNKNFFRGAVLEAYSKRVNDGENVEEKFDFVSEGSDFIGRKLKPLLVEELSCEDHIVKVMNVDKPPFLHVQSLGQVAGLDMHLSPEFLQEGPEKIEWEVEVREAMHDVRDKDLWGSAYDK
ncbi:hypothetical protein Pmar_PMAR003793, partial [Perkinsus marinus ATCC 50983]